MDEADQDCSSSTTSNNNGPYSSRCQLVTSDDYDGAGAQPAATFDCDSLSDIVVSEMRNGYTLLKIQLIVIVYKGVQPLFWIIIKNAILSTFSYQLVPDRQYVKGVEVFINQGNYYAGNKRLRITKKK